MQEKVVVVLDELRAIMQSYYGEQFSHLILYGSQARSDMTAESDIDVLVVLRGEVNPNDEITHTINQIADLSLKYDVVVSCLFMSADRFQSEQSPLLLNVRREGILVS